LRVKDIADFRIRVPGAWMCFMTMPRTTDSLGNGVAREVFTGLPPRYDRLAWLLSFGQDRRWRRSVVDKIATGRPRHVLDVATGPAGVALAVARRTDATVVGVDLNEPMLRRGLRNVQAADGPGDVMLVAGRAEQLPFRDECFDAICFSYLLRYVDDPAAAIVEMTRCLRPGGTMASLEFFVPPAAAWRAAWRVYVSAVLPLAGWMAGGSPWWRVGRFLSRSIPAHYRRYPLDWHVRAWEQAGFRDVGWQLMSLGGGLVMWGTKAAGP
jgi:demethylmenaquinone methyltransferase/2-methoxy-6-polyprenyl-1,4-benzoquinol methylase